MFGLWYIGAMNETHRLLEQAHSGLEALILLARSALVLASRRDTDEGRRGEAACLLEQAAASAQEYLRELYPDRRV